LVKSGLISDRLQSIFTISPFLGIFKNNNGIAARITTINNITLISKSPYMADKAGKSMSVDSEVVVHTESVGYTAQAVVLLQGDAPVPVEQHSLFLMRPTFHMRI
jgi:hypothetical protein